MKYWNLTFSTVHGAEKFQFYFSSKCWQIQSLNYRNILFTFKVCTSTIHILGHIFGFPVKNLVIICMHIWIPYALVLFFHHRLCCWICAVIFIAHLPKAVKKEFWMWMQEIISRDMLHPVLYKPQKAHQPIQTVLVTDECLNILLCQWFKDISYSSFRII